MCSFSEPGENPKRMWDLIFESFSTHTSVDAHGYHCVLCTADGNPDRTALSDALRDECARMLRAANHHGVQIEPRTNEATQHRGDVSSGSYVTGNRVVLDIVTIAPYRESVVDLAAHIPGIAAKTAEDAKDAKHGPTIRAQGGTFIPLAWEVGGHWGDKAVAFFKLIARQATSTISEAAAFEAYWLRRLSIVGRKQFASLLRRRLADTRRLVPVDPRLLNVDPRAHVLHFHHTSTVHARTDPGM